MSGGTLPQIVGDAILVDEVGLESGVYGRYRLRSAYQPIFESRGPLLLPVAVEGVAAPHLAGEAIDPARFLDGVPTRDRRLVEAVCRALTLRNHRNIGVPGLELWLRYDPHADPDFALFLRETSFMAGRLSVVGIDPQLLVCEIAEPEEIDPLLQARLAGEMHALGTRIAIDGFRAGEVSLGEMARLRPDIVRLEGCFREICGEPTAIRLLASLVSRFRQRGVRVLIAGIEGPAELGQALACGADLLQGRYLASPMLVGTVFREEPLDKAELLHRTVSGAPPVQGPFFPSR